ncbi:MAG TPA: cupin domain-containing protein [Gemmatimonadales bacterium]|nr:cupin domain-containing protein [Gemmatimonadales bacterium]
MRAPTTIALIVACAALLLPACDEDRPTSPTALPDGPAFQVAAEPFTVKAPIAPFFINQAPEFMFRSNVPADLVIQRLVSPAGPPGAWHTHPGPAFALVEQGQVMLTRITKDGCTTAVYGPGDTYYEVADQVHRVTYLGTENVEYKVRFNIPIGAPLSTPAADPGC